MEITSNMVLGSDGMYFIRGATQYKPGPVKHWNHDTIYIHDDGMGVSQRCRPQSSER